MFHAFYRYIVLCLSKIQFSNSINTHHFYFTKLYRCILHTVAWTRWCISRWSLVDEHNSLSFGIDGDDHDLGWTAWHRIMVVYKVFWITQWIKILSVVGVNIKSTRPLKSLENREKWKSSLVNSYKIFTTIVS